MSECLLTHITLKRHSILSFEISLSVEVFPAYTIPRQVKITVFLGKLHWTKTARIWFLFNVISHMNSYSFHLRKFSSTYTEKDIIYIFFKTISYDR